MKTERRVFQLKHALLCNPTVGPSLIQHWAKQGYLVHGTETRGSVERLTFSFSEIVYASLLVRLSWFGAVSKDTVCHYSIHDDVNIDFLYLNQSNQIFQQLREKRWDVLVRVEATLSYLTSPTARSKKQAQYYAITLMPLEKAKDQFKIWLDDEKEPVLLIIDLLKVRARVKEALGIS